MANPQIENGYTKIANEILEALASHRLSGQEYQIVLFIIRKTFGFNKTCDFISMGQISKITGINRPLVSRILNKLIEKNIISVTQNDNSMINCLCFSKDYDNWKVLHKKITLKGVTQNNNTLLHKKITGVTQNDNKGVTQNDTYKRKKETITKETLTKESNFFEDFWKIYPARNGKKIGKKDSQAFFVKQFTKQEDCEALLQATKNYSKSQNVLNGYVKDPVRFLKKDYWQEWLTPETITPKTTKSKLPGLTSSGLDPERYPGIVAWLEEKTAEREAKKNAGE